MKFWFKYDVLYKHDCLSFCRELAQIAVGTVTGISK